MSNDTTHGPERLRVYALAVHLGELIDDLLTETRCRATLASQIRRAADSLVLNIGEGSAHFSPGRKLYHYQTALGSVAEVIAGLARLRVRHPNANIFRARNTADLISAMLTALIHTQQNRLKK